MPLYLRGPDGDGVHWPTRDGGRVGTATALGDGAVPQTAATSTSHVHPGIARELSGGATELSGGATELSPARELEPEQSALSAGYPPGDAPPAASHLPDTSSTSR